MDDLLRDFLEETVDNLARIGPSLAALEQAPQDADLQDRIFDLLHTVQGASSFLGLPRLEAIAGAGQALITAMRDGAVRPNSVTVQVLSTTVVAISKILEAVAAHEAEPAGDDMAVLDALRDAHLVQPEVVTPIDDVVADPLPSALVLSPETPRAVSVFSARQVDRIATLAEELVLIRNTLNHLMKARDDEELEDALRRLDDVTSDLGADILKGRREFLADEGAAEADQVDLAQVIVVEAGGLCFAIPRREILEIVSAVLSDDDAIRTRDEDSVHADLAVILEVDRQQSSTNARATLVIEGDGTKINLDVDRALDAQEVLARPLPPALRKIEIYRALTVLSDGRVAPILNVGALVRTAILDAPRALIEG